MKTTTKLDPHSRALMERGFGEDFESVTLSHRPDAWFPGGALACTVGEQIFVNGSRYRHGSALGRRVLAHELAHVVQKRRGRGLKETASSPGSRWELEAEADAASACVVSGGRFACERADEPEIARFWGPLGHYYTVYFVLLAAGVDDTTSQMMAYYAQIPDLVEELDAKAFAYDTLDADVSEVIKSGSKIIKAASKLVVPGVKILVEIAAMLEVSYLELVLFLIMYKTLGDDFADQLDTEIERYEKVKRMTVEEKRGLAKRIAINTATLKEIQIGLHCLSGGPSDAEVKKRTAILKDLDVGSFDFGLALHAFGDAFAHQRLDDEKTMYSGPTGHAFSSFSLTHFGEAPDFIYKRPELYIKYGGALFDIIKSKGYKSAMDEKTLKKRLQDAADAESKQHGDQSKGVTIRTIAKETTGIELDGYNPPEDAIPWKEFLNHRDNSGVDLGPGDFHTATILAKTWTVR
jgi:hypothetical protein